MNLETSSVEKSIRFKVNNFYQFVMSNSNLKYLVTSKDIKILKTKSIFFLFLRKGNDFPEENTPKSIEFEFSLLDTKGLK